MGERWGEKSRRNRGEIEEKWRRNRGEMGGEMFFRSCARLGKAAFCSEQVQGFNLRPSLIWLADVNVSGTGYRIFYSKMLPNRATPLSEAFFSAHHRSDATTSMTHFCLVLLHQICMAKYKNINVEMLISTTPQFINKILYF